LIINNKAVLITGGAGRLGSSFARAIIKQGGKVVLADIDKANLQLLENELGDKKCLGIVANVSHLKEMDLCITKTVEKFGCLDGVIHSSYPRSSGWGTRFEDLNQKFLNEDLTQQLGGAILFSQRVLNYFVKQGYGNLIHISSIQGITAPKFDHYVDTEMTSPIEYTAIKSGIIAITQYLAKYYKNKNIRVNCVSPGGIFDKQPDSFVRKYRNSCINKGLLSAEDIIGSVLFLLSDYSQYINGQNIIIDDGWTL